MCSGNSPIKKVYYFRIWNLDAQLTHTAFVLRQHGSYVRRHSYTIPISTKIYLSQNQDVGDRDINENFISPSTS